MNLSKKYDIIISNPPYSIKDKVIERCYNLKKPFMLLMPLPALQGKQRFKYFSKGVELLVFDDLIGCRYFFEYIPLKELGLPIPK